MAYAFVNANQNETAAAGSTIAVTLNGVTAGNLLVVTVSYINTNARTATVADGAGNTYDATGNIFATNIPWRHYQFRCVVATGGNLTITATLSGSTGEKCIQVMEFSGPAASPLDGANVTTADASAGADGLESIGPLTPSENNCLIVASLADGTGTDYSLPTGGFTLQQQTTNGITNCAQFYLIQTTAGAATCGATSGAFGGYCGVMAVYKAAAAGGGSAVPVFVDSYRRRST